MQFSLPMMLFIFPLLCILLCQLCLAKDQPTDRSTLPDCSPENLKLREASKGSWYLLPDGSFHYEFDHCNLRRFTRAMATKCLKGSHIVFMGDSLSRYFYLSLAYLFAHDEWSSKFAKLPSHSSYHRSILSERDFQNWSWFYHKSNKLLNHGKRISEICDCFRNDSLPFVSVKGEDPHQQTDCLENRHFRYIPESSSTSGDSSAVLNDQENDVRLSYIQWYGLMPMKGHTSISIHPRNESYPSFVESLNRRLCPANGESFFPLSRFCSDQRRDRNRELQTFDFPDFCHQLDDCASISDRSKSTKCQRFEREVLGPMGTTHVILNVGWHSGLLHCDPKFLEKLVDAADRYFPEAGPADKSRREIYKSSLKLAKVTWRAATHGAIFREHDKAAQDYSQQVGSNKIEYFDVYGMTEILRLYHGKVEGRDVAALKSMINVLPSDWPTGVKSVKYENIQSTWVDNSHLEPWAYSQIHDVFLNSVCVVV
jgi:hypothetical protein